uniref:Triple QxxK/R motif-containing protein family n=1 Tax=Podoviridae sp. ctsNK10 TaxID=2826582 RepID=A0A8S5NKU2_9CAUD|nr:MAG TPA: Triple QxxK/R motif-containing protein family [Podoviridae sp. ctsNK10]
MTFIQKVLEIFCILQFAIIIYVAFYTFLYL